MSAASCRRRRRGCHRFRRRRRRCLPHFCHRINICVGIALHRWQSIVVSDFVSPTEGGLAQSNAEPFLLWPKSCCEAFYGLLQLRL